MARVFVATDTALGRPVVIKVLSPDLAEGVSWRRFAREIRLAASLQNSRAFHHSSLAMVAMALGDTARTLDELQPATEVGEFWPSAPILVDRWIDLVRSSARMQQIVQRVGLDADRFMALPGSNAR